MAFTEKYISVLGAGAHNGVDAANSWTLAEGLTNLAAGERGNMIEGAYSSGADAFTNAGTNQAAIVLRGYTSAIGDLVGDRVDGNGAIDDTNYPVVTLTGTLTPNTYITIEAVKFTGSIAGILVGSTAIDDWSAINCVFLNTANSASAIAVRTDNYCSVVNCDAECSGAAHGEVVRLDANVNVQNCRIKAVANDTLLLVYGSVVGNILYGDPASVGITLSGNAVGRLSIVRDNTIYNMDTAIYLSINSQLLDPLYAINNFASDCSNWIDCAYVATANQPVVEVNNWLYNVTTSRTGVSDFSISRQIGPTSGAAGAYFENAGTGDFNLVSTAPGYGAGLWPYSDVGAVQALRAGGGGTGGGFLIDGGRIQ